MSLAMSSSMRRRHVAPSTLITALVLGGALNACIGNIGPGGDDAEGEGPSGPVADPQVWPEEAQVRRVSVEVYRNAMLDVLQVPPGLLGELSYPLEPESHGFDNGADQPVGYAQMKAYYDNAEILADSVSHDAEARARIGADCTGEDDLDACLGEAVGRLGRRLYGRRLAQDEVEALVALGASQEGFSNAPEDRLQTMLMALLQSPTFLLRLELSDETSPSEPGLTLRSNAELARALAELLWVSVPDDDLLEAAEQGRLRDPDGLRKEIARMLEDERARRFAHDYFRQVLDTDEYGADSRPAYPITGKVAAAMVGEVNAFVDEVVFERKGSFEDLLTTPVGFVNQHNAPLYGEQSDGNEMKRIELDPERYAGLLTHSGYMTLLSNPEASHPIRRGAHILEDFLCTELTPVDLSPEDQLGFTGDTTREQVANGTASPRCQVCHEMINGIGFAFESFDQVGRWRTEENGIEVDTTGSFALDGESVDYQSAVDFAKFLGASEAANACFARRLATYARGVSAPSQDGVVRQLSSLENPSVLSLITELAASFTQRRIAHERSASAQEETCQ